MSELLTQRAVLLSLRPSSMIQHDLIMLQLNTCAMATSGYMIDITAKRARGRATRIQAVLSFAGLCTLVSDPHHCGLPPIS